MQTELNKVSARSRILRARDPSVRKGSRRAHADPSPRGASREAVHRLGGRLRLHRLGERTLRLPKGSSSPPTITRKIGLSRYRGAPARDSQQPARGRSPEGHQPSAAGTRPAQAARLTDPHLWFAYRIGVYLTLGRKGVTASEVYVGGVPDPALSTSRPRWPARRHRPTSGGTPRRRAGPRTPLRCGRRRRSPRR